VLLTALIVAYCYATEILVALGAPAEDAERATLVARMTGPYAPLFWLAVSCSCLGPLLLAWRRVRGSVPALLAISVAVNVGMWLERFVIVASSLSRDRLPFGWFSLLLLVGLKVLPPFPVAELKEQAAHQGAGPPAGEARHAG
jgi:molybdopterin-containing oxidoreductase family membrane subunit